MAEERVRYGDADLAEFKQIILKKLEQARADYELLRSSEIYREVYYSQQKGVEE